jgi:hypothetical protein
MPRQRLAPILIPANESESIRLEPVSGEGGSNDISEAHIQNFVHAHPDCLPIAEIDPIFANPVAICRELPTPAGPIDNFMVTSTGLPVLVECKLWRNPQARREVVGQILDYAKELSRWSSSDLQRAVRQRLKCGGDPVLEAVRAVAPETDEITFNDALTHNLRRGRFLLLIIGDGIREGVEAIGDYLQAHAGLHFSLGLVELPIFALPDGSQIVVPRVLARTALITRTVVALPDGFVLESPVDEVIAAGVSASSANITEQQQFWQGFLERLRLDDPEQRIPGPARQGYLNFMMPVPSGSSWINVYRNRKLNEVGVELLSSGSGPGVYVRKVIAEDWATVKSELGGNAELTERDGRPLIFDRKVFAGLEKPENRDQAYAWLAERVNTFVNVLRPRVRSAATDYVQHGE